MNRLAKLAKTLLFGAWLPLIGSPAAAVEFSPCSAEALQKDVRSTLVGNVEVSNLWVQWRTGNEGSDLLGYELWSRAQGSGARLAVITPNWSCPMLMTREARVPYDPQLSYWLEIKLRDGSIRMLPVPVR